MKRYFSILSFMIVLAIMAHGQAPSTAQGQPEKLNKQQLNALIATAQTPEEHLRIAKFYDQQAQDFLDQAKEHEAMIASYKANSSLSTSKNYASTVGHCEYFVKTFRQMATKSGELARLHTQMAKDAGHPVPASRLVK